MELISSNTPALAHKQTIIRRKETSRKDLSVCSLYSTCLPHCILISSDHVATKAQRRDYWDGQEYFLAVRSLDEVRRDIQWWINIAVGKRCFETDLQIGRLQSVLTPYWGRRDILWSSGEYFQNEAMIELATQALTLSSNKHSPSQAYGLSPSYPILWSALICTEPERLSKLVRSLMNDGIVRELHLVAFRKPAWQQTWASSHESKIREISGKGWLMGEVGYRSSSSCPACWTPGDQRKAGALGISIAGNAVGWEWAVPEWTLKELSDEASGKSLCRYESGGMHERWFRCSRLKWRAFHHYCRRDHPASTLIHTSFPARYPVDFQLWDIGSIYTLSLDVPSQYRYPCNPEPASIDSVILPHL